MIHAHSATKWVLAVLVAAVAAGSGGCSDWRLGKDSSEKERTTRRTEETNQSYAYAREPAEEAAGDGQSRWSMNLPGNNDNLLRIEKIGATEVRAGQDYTYKVRVTNTSGLMLENVQVFGTTSTGPAIRTQRIEAAARPEPAQPARTERVVVDERRRRITAGDSVAGSVKAEERYEVRTVEAPRREPVAEEAPVYAIPREGQNAERAQLGEKTWKVGTLMPGESKIFEETMKLDAEGTVNQCFTATFQPALCTVINVVKPSLSLRKTATDRADICEAISYHYVLTNTGTASIRDARVEETLPEGLTTADGSRQVVLSAGDLAPGKAVEKTVQIRAAKAGEYSGAAKATAGDGFSVESDSTKTIVTQPVIAVTVEAPETSYLGQPATINVTVTNKGDTAARNVALRSDGLGEIAWTSDGKTASGDIGTLAAGESRKFTATWANPRQGAINGRVIATATCAQTITQPVKTQIVGIPALLLEAVDLSDPIRVGEVVHYVISVTNQGSATAHNVLVGVELPKQQELISATGQTAAPADAKGAGAKFDFAPVRELAPGAKATWKVDVRAGDAADVLFRATVRSDELKTPGSKEEPTRLIGTQPTK